MSLSNLVDWIRTNFIYYPNCSKLNNLSQLKSGIHAAQILTQILPNNYHQSFLSQIQVKKLNVDTCINNWKIVKQKLIQYLKQVSTPSLSAIVWRVANTTGEVLYYREQETIKFFQQVIIKLWVEKQQINSFQNPAVTYPKTVMAHLLDEDEVQLGRNKKSNQYTNNIQREGKNNMNLSQLSDIANTSFPILYQSQALEREVKARLDKIDLKKERNSFNIPQVEVEVETNIMVQVEQLEKWVISRLQFLPNEHHETLGLLINKMFCSSRLNDTIIKQAHFKHGALFVYRKVLQFIIENPLAEKINKLSSLSLMKNIEEKGVVRQTEFWRLIQDLCTYDISKGSKQPSQYNSNRSNQNKGSIDKQNAHPNIIRKGSSKTLSKCKTSKTLNSNANQLNTNTYSRVQVKQAEQWLMKQFGLEHTINKVNGQMNLLQNPLTNGSLVSSILMRVKIGKPLVNKYPNCMQQVKNNWELINKAACLRGYQSFRSIVGILNANIDGKELNNIVYSKINQFRIQYEKKQPKKRKNQKDQNCNQCQNQYKIRETSKVMTEKEKEQLSQWLLHNFGYQFPTDIFTVTHLTDICRLILNINIYKETTSRIQINNVEKVLAELRRIGLGDYYSIKKQDVMDISDKCRWKILKDIRWLIDGRIQYCRA